MGGALGFKVKTAKITVKRAFEICKIIMNKCSSGKFTADIYFYNVTDKKFLEDVKNRQSETGGILLSVASGGS